MNLRTPNIMVRLDLRLPQALLNALQKVAGHSRVEKIYSGFKKDYKRKGGSKNELEKIGSSQMACRL